MTVDIRRYHDSERRLFARFAVDPSPATRDAIVVQFMPLARRLAWRYRDVEDLEDLEQIAAIGLHQGDRSLRPPARAGVLHVRVPDDPGRTQAPPARPRVVGPPASRRSNARRPREPQTRTRSSRNSGAPPPCPRSPHAPKAPRAVLEARCKPPTHAGPSRSINPPRRRRCRRPRRDLAIDEAGLRRRRGRACCSTA